MSARGFAAGVLLGAVLDSLGWMGSLGWYAVPHNLLAAVLQGLALLLVVGLFAWTARQVRGLAR